MTHTISISSRKLGYFPEELLKKLKIKGKGKVVVFEDNSQLIIKPIRDILEFAGMGKDNAKFECWKNFREKIETGYEEVSFDTNIF